MVLTLSVPPAEQAMIIATIIVYIIVVLGFGFWAYRKTRSSEDWMTAGRRQRGWLVGLSWGATYFSAVILVGFGGKTALVGLGYSWITWGNCLIGGVIASLLGYQVWKVAKNTGASTVPELFGRRYDSRVPQVVLGLGILIFLVVYVAATFKAAGSVLQVLTGWPYEAGVVTATIITAIYITIGGLLADLYTDALQAVVLIAGTLALAASALAYFGGFEGAYSYLANYAGEINSWAQAQGVAVKIPNPGGFAGFPPVGHVFFWVVIWIVFFTSTNFFWPHLPQRFFAFKNRRQITWSLIVATIFTFLVPFCVYNCFAPVAIPIISQEGIETPAKIYALAPTNPLVNETISGYAFWMKLGPHPVAEYMVDLIIPYEIRALWPPWAAAIYLAAIFCAIMSTCDGILHMMGAALGNDVVRAWIKRDISERGVYKIITIATFVIGVIAMIIALRPFAPILEQFAFAVGGTAGLMAAPMLGLFWKRVGRGAVIAGMVAGFVGWLVITVLSQTSMNLFWELGQWAGNFPPYTANPALAAAAAKVYLGKSYTFLWINNYGFSAQEAIQIFNTNPADFGPYMATHMIPAVSNAIVLNQYVVGVVCALVVTAIAAFVGKPLPKEKLDKIFAPV